MVKTELFVVGAPGSTVAVSRAVRALKKGGLVLFPTETVYGLAADPARKTALRRIYGLKRRAPGKKIALQVDTVSKARALVKKNVLFERCARSFWPGPVTLVARARRGGRKIGIRIPKHALAIKLLRLFGRPLAVTSANLSSRKELWRNKDLTRCFEGRVEVMIVGGVRPGRASTVIDVTGEKPVILRKGPIKTKEILRVGIR